MSSLPAVYFLYIIEYNYISVDIENLIQKKLQLAVTTFLYTYKHVCGNRINFKLKEQSRWWIGWSLLGMQIIEDPCWTKKLFLELIGDSTIKLPIDSKQHLHIKDFSITGNTLGRKKLRKQNLSANSIFITVDKPLYFLKALGLKHFVSSAGFTQWCWSLFNQDNK